MGTYTRRLHFTVSHRSTDPNHFNLRYVSPILKDFYFPQLSCHCNRRCHRRHLKKTDPKISLELLQYLPLLRGLAGPLSTTCIQRTAALAASRTPDILNNVY